MQSLDDRTRRQFLTLSAMLCAIPVFLAPLAGRSSFELASEQAAFNARFNAPQLPPAWNDSPVSIERDPFIADIQETPPPDSSVAGMQVVQGQSMGFVLPANRVASGAPNQGAAFGLPTVRAIVTGLSAHALIEENARARVVGVGDVVAGSPIAAIEAGGIRLKNGTIFTLTEEHP